MAVLRQQVSFVKQLFMSGMIDATEAEVLANPDEANSIHETVGLVLMNQLCAYTGNELQYFLIPEL